jgi:alkaline phosphatase
MKTSNLIKLFAAFLFLVSMVLVYACRHMPDSDETDATAVPQNIILMIGDGMGFAQVQAIQLATGVDARMLSASVHGAITTHSYDALITDSGAGGTAIATGHKTRNGMIGMTPDSVATLSMLEIFAKAGKSTGIVVSCAVTHATPASFIAKNIRRSNYEAIALDFLESPVDVVIGGGISNFRKRKDGRDLIQEMTSRGFTYAEKLPETAPRVSKWMVLTDSIHPHKVQHGRTELLPLGTRLAMEVLSANPNGFFLMVEGSQIDWAGHANDSAYLVNEMIDFDRAVAEAFSFADANPGTLVIVTADHETGGLTFPHLQDGSSQVRFAYSTGDHTGAMVPVYAYGTGAKKFAGFYDNTDLFSKLLRLTGISK